MRARGPRAFKPPPIGSGFVTAGDSLTSCQIENNQPGTCWPTAVAAQLGVTVENGAVGGKTSTDWLVRGGVVPDHWPCGEVPAGPSPYDLFVPKAQGKKWAVFMIGAGDSLREVECPPGGLDNWAPPTTPDQYEANIRELIQRVWQDVPGLLGVILATPPKFMHPFAGALGLGAANDLLDQYHVRLQNIAGTERRARTGPMFDMRATFLGTDYGSDVLHPAQIGQDKLAAAFAAGLAGYR